MSTTGHYTRYINQYPGWSDNCDTMYQPVYNGLIRCDECLAQRKDCSIKNKKEEYCRDKIGYFTVEHNCGNTWSFCVFSDEDRSHRLDNRRIIYHLPIYEFTGKKAIQNVLEFMKNYPVNTLIDSIFKYRFYNRSYMDYFNYYQEVSGNA